MNDWLVQLLQTSDALFPTGAYAHSSGLEGVVQRGLVHDQATLSEFLRRTVAPALEHFELPFVRRAHEAAAREDCARLRELDDLYGAMKGAHELRQASASVGSQRLQMLMRVAPHPLLTALEAMRHEGAIQAHAPIIFGAQMAVNATPLEVALTAFYYQSLASLVSASLKLIRIGPIGSQQVLTECLTRVADGVARAGTIADEDVGWFCATLDIASALHETAYTRLFIS